MDPQMKKIARRPAWKTGIGAVIGRDVAFFAPGSDGNGSIRRGKVVGLHEHEIYRKPWVIVSPDDTVDNSNTLVLVNPKSLLELNNGLWGVLTSGSGEISLNIDAVQTFMEGYENHRKQKLA